MQWNTYRWIHIFTIVACEVVGQNGEKKPDRYVWHQKNKREDGDYHEVVNNVDAEQAVKIGRIGGDTPPVKACDRDGWNEECPKPNEICLKIIGIKTDLKRAFCRVDLLSYEMFGRCVWYADVVELVREPELDPVKQDVAKEEAERC